MQTHLLASLILVAATSAMGAQTTRVAPAPNQPASTSPSEPSKALTLIGCVRPDATKTDWYTLSVKDTQTTYRLSGASVKGFVWRNVRIVGGLVPSPNLAAQAGAIDETKIAMAQQGANPQGRSNTPFFEFRVSTVRALSGNCSPAGK